MIAWFKGPSLICNNCHTNVSQGDIFSGDDCHISRSIAKLNFNLVESGDGFILYSSTPPIPEKVVDLPI